MRVQHRSLDCRSFVASRGTRRGAIAVLVAFFMVVLLGMVAFAVDLGYILSCQSEIDRSCDAAALAGVGVLADGSDAAIAKVKEFAALNPVGGKAMAASEVNIETGVWDKTARAFTPSSSLPSTLRVTLTRNDQPLFFGRIFGKDLFNVQAQAIATYQPRDIVLVLDFSASMNDDSTFAAISTLGQPAIEANLLQIYQELGSPTYGTMQWTPQYISSTTNNTIKTTLGLRVSGVDKPYPYPSGSWDDFINYVKSDSTINSAGYRKKYGYMTLVHYWLAKQPMYSQTPDLWKTSEQPVKGLKDAVTIFLAYLQNVQSEDRVSLVIYTGTDGTAKLESGLTTNMSLIGTTMQQRQAGHYHSMTNIGAGMQKGRLELQNNARVGAQKMMVLMTDGLANLPSNTSTAKALVNTEAAAAAAAKIPIVTISLGTGADTALMQSVADVTGGVHFNVPGNQSVAEKTEDLKAVFRKVADDRPLQLVQ